MHDTDDRAPSGESGGRAGAFAAGRSWLRRLAWAWVRQDADWAWIIPASPQLGEALRLSRHSEAANERP